MEINVWGLVAIVILYVVIFIIGIIAGRKAKRKGKQLDSEELILANRNIGPFVGIFTMTATWVGGGYINGTAEEVVKNGLVWCQAPWGYGLALAVGGLFFAKPMRESGYITMLDPFHEKYGPVMAALLYIPALIGDLLWAAAILAALGSSLTVVIGLDNTISIVVSAAIAVLYTLMGGLYSVAYTDVAQLLFMMFGLVLAFPFAMKHEAVSDIAVTAPDWLGSIDVDNTGTYLDSAMQLIMGGIPWQEYFQRVMSSRTARQAQLMSCMAAFGCILSAVPPAIIGAIAASTNWTMTGYYRDFNLTSVPPEEYKNLLPLVLNYLTPPVVSFFGLGAVSAAVMSSTDSIILSMSSLFAHNVYRPLRQFLGCGRKASEREVTWVLRISVVVYGALATLMAITMNSVYALLFICSDAIYVILFPQLTCVLFFKKCNVYGSAIGYVLGWILRLGAGESTFGIPTFIYFPWYDYENNIQRFPFKLLIVIITFPTIILFSLLFDLLIRKEIIPDFLSCCLAETEADDTSNKEREGTKDLSERETKDIHKPRDSDVVGLRFRKMDTADVDFHFEDPKRTSGIWEIRTPAAVEGREAMTLNSDNAGRESGTAEVPSTRISD
ncbi:high affinity choline transporter 1-like [Lingula anatina]|uniref:High affinity choline transporter 1-like n=1 Tax=Lingula anatina TaxID=7574 RepID=A0A1S3HAH8_LINAN|nr:high affinity choline transporter 1-like [Lingula anatina]|eukprot:XP_013382456.1 high affinity choline transporter 1-like [Lingula anatina]